MDEEQLRETLIKLRAELQHAASVNESERELLNSLMHDVQELLARSAHHPSQGDRSLSQRLETAIQRLEASHPNLTAAMGRVVDALSQMGI